LKTLAIAVALLLAGCASTPEVPLYRPPEPLPVRVGVKVGSGFLSQLYGGGVLNAWEQMPLFRRLVHPPDRLAKLDVRLKLRIERLEGGEGQVALVLEKQNRVILRHIAVIEGLAAEGWQARLASWGDRTIRSHARKLANSAAQEIDARRDELLPLLEGEDGS
jgi:hypothetical protein